MPHYQHPSAIVDPGAKIGESSRIWHFVHVCSGAHIGEGVSLGQNVFVGNKVIIGDNCKIQNNVSVYDNVTLEEGVFCGPSMVFTNVYNPRSLVERKSEYRDTLVKKGSHIGRELHDCLRCHDWTIFVCGRRCGGDKKRARLCVGRGRTSSTNWLDERIRRAA